MNLWQRFEKKRNLYTNSGFSLRFEKGIEEDLRTKYINFARYLRKNYVFPVHINVYILNCEKVRLISGAMAYGSFKWFPKRNPRIKIPSAIENHLLNDYTKEEIYEQILSSFVHEISHYYQWYLDLDQDNATSERQANYFRYRIIDEFNLEQCMTHQMNLHNSPFEMIKKGAKTYELRLYDEKRRLISVGDSIIFTNTKTGEQLTAKVENLHIFKGFKELYDALPLDKCGYLKEELKTASYTDMSEYYPQEKQNKYGALAIEISLF